MGLGRLGHDGVTGQFRAIPSGFVVVDASGFTLAYVYAREDDAVRLTHLSREEAGKIADMEREAKNQARGKTTG